MAITARHPMRNDKEALLKLMAKTGADWSAYQPCYIVALQEIE